MNPKVAFAIALLVILLAGGWIWYERTHLPTPAGPLQEEFDWSFVDLGVDAASSTPLTNVTLAVAGVPALSLGAFNGNCFAVAGSGADLLTNELSGVVCLWDGKGEEIGVFQNGSALELEEGTVVGTDATNLTRRSDFTQLTKQL